MALKFPQYISTTERTISVIGIIDKEKFEKEEDKKNYVNVNFTHGKGYIAEDESIWIWCDKKPMNKNAYPYFWYNEEEDKLEFSDPPELMRAAYNVENMKDISLVNIIETTKENEELFNEEEINDLNAAAGFFRSLLAERLVMRHTPELKFIFDTSISYGNHIEKIIEEIHEKDNK